MRLSNTNIRINRHWKSILLLALGLSLVYETYATPTAQPSAAQCLTGLARLANDRAYDGVSSAIETEPWVFRNGALTRDAAGVFALIEPSNKRVRPLWKNAILNRDSLTALNLLRKHGSGARQSFFHDPVLHGFELVREVNQGSQWLDLSAFAGDRELHHGSPDTIHDASRVEFHFRVDNVRPSRVQQAVWKLFDAVGIRWPHAHQHIVVDFPMERLKHSEDESLRLTEFLARTHTLAEMITVIEKELPIKIQRAITGDIEWGVWNASMVQSILRRLQATSRTGQVPVIGNDFKLGYIGLHFSDKYRAKTDKLGVQLRSVNRRYSDFEVLADRLGDRLKSGDYGFELKTKGANPSRALFEWVPMHPLKDTAFWADGVYDILWNSEAKSFQPTWTSILENEESQIHLRLLLYNWLSHPLASRLEKARLLQLQQDAIRKLMSNVSDSVTITRQFLLESGVYELWRNSILAPVAEAVKSE